LLGLGPESISYGECVLCAQLPIDARRNVVAYVRTQKADAVIEVIDVYTRAILQHRIWNLPRIHTLLVPPLTAQEERSVFRDGAAYRPIELIAVVCGNRGRKRIAGIESLVVALDKGLPVQLVGSGLGKNFDAPIAQAVELRREGVLIDANLANRRLGRQLPAAEAVDVDLPAVGSCRGPR